MAELDFNLTLILPEPTLVFTLPSLHDGLPIDCRVYHPLSLSPALPKSAHPQPWRKHAAIVAHPYAPLGGSYDDPVVGLVASTLLRLGFLVMTFNFRGAHESAGRTSWTAKAERFDYMSAVGFLSHYVHFVDPFHQSSNDGTDAAATNHTPILLMCGYSYGSMITTQIPSLHTILKSFDTPVCLSNAAEIRLRAQHLAEGQNMVIASARAAVIDRQSGRSPRRSLGLRIGGDEEIRQSHESRQSFTLDAEDKIRKGVAELMAKARKGHKKRHASNSVDPIPEDDGASSPSGEQEQEHGAKAEHPIHECLLPVPDRVSAMPAYLLISPLQGVITNLATMSFSAPLSRSLGWRPFSRSSSKATAEKAPSQPEPQGVQDSTNPGVVSAEAEDKLTRNPTLAIYGDRDGFVAARKLREWASRLEKVSGSKFRAHEVSNAGHFWNQGKTAYTLRDAVLTFAGGLLDGKES